MFLYKKFCSRTVRRKMEKRTSLHSTLRSLIFEIAGLDSVIRATCQAEVVHEIIIIVSFIPVVFSLWVGALPVFIITSFFGAAVCDLVFVVLQRYNRPRLIRLREAKNKIGESQSRNTKAGLSKKL